ncbi:hypothetical protein HLH34_15030 [Gluconacetobacter azotocaptans]|uniref:Uncharacterized protein n=1 Tax=Gluconacetobacter azotocaptans TaxID=142834 RepID=A0A7W4JUT4_9PROT|nr:hypothetical protein [Gluconacetobacter azotocaptans]MBB2191259.1 hypothetical protein [Gluconacetobacter azotocaptans]MBM9402043.1 hypothetical protein [Gluconacetobacter azotocaptans]GBQ25754.1 hypothetical protein AA13594_0012 [Gluconacetobacter azotocaptans DSM 13594]
MPAQTIKRDGPPDAPPRAIVSAPTEPTPPVSSALSTAEAERRDPATRTPAQIHAAHRARLRRVRRR